MLDINSMALIALLDDPSAAMAAMASLAETRVTWRSWRLLAAAMLLTGAVLLALG